MDRIQCSSHIRHRWTGGGACHPLSAQSVYISGLGMHTQQSCRPLRNMFYDFSRAFNTIHPLPCPKWQTDRLQIWGWIHIWWDGLQTASRDIRVVHLTPWSVVLEHHRELSLPLPCPRLTSSITSSSDTWRSTQMPRWTSWNWTPSRPRRWWTTSIRQNTISNFHPLKGLRWRRGKCIDTCDWTRH